MSDHIFTLPPSIEPHNLKRLIEDLHAWRIRSSIKPGDRLFLDFQACQFITPVGILYLASIQGRFAETGVSVYVFQPTGKIRSFLSIYGLLPEPRPEDVYAVSMQRYAIRIHSCSSMTEGLAVSNKIGPHILMRTKCKPGTEASLRWTIWEIIDNAGRHGYGCYDENRAYPKPVLVCAFSYKAKVEVAVLDRGIGVHQSLRSQYPNVTARQAVELALRKGVSGHPSGAGFGLWCTKELARQGGGSFCMWSSGYGVSVSKSDQKTFSVEGLEGTIVSFSFDQNIDAPFSKIHGDTPEDFLAGFEVEDAS